MTGIIGAMSIETDGFVEKLSNVRKKKIGKLVFVKGDIFGKEVVVCRCGIGKVNSSIAATLMIEKFKVRLLINIGVAGGIMPGIRQGDIVIARACVQHDYDQTPDGLKKAQVSGFDFIEIPSDEESVEKMERVLSGKNFSYYTGIIASGDQFIADKGKAALLYNEFNAYACDMESAAVAHVCQILNTKYFAMRAISDSADGTAIESFYTFLQKSSEKSIAALCEFLKA